MVGRRTSSTTLVPTLDHFKNEQQQTAASYLLRTSPPPNSFLRHDYVRGGIWIGLLSIDVCVPVTLSSIPAMYSILDH